MITAPEFGLLLLFAGIIIMIIAVPIVNISLSILGFALWQFAFRLMDGE